MIRRRLAVLAAVLAALVGEWVGHGIAYYRVAGLRGLEAAVTSGVHDYMLPLGAMLLLAAALGSTVWIRAWHELGRRLDRSAALMARLRRDGRTAVPPGMGAPPPCGRRVPTFGASVTALALPLAALQTSLYLVQENLERSLHGMPAPGLTPLVDGFGAALWVQALVALVMAFVLVLALRRLTTRSAAAQRLEHLARLLWHRLQRATSSARPAPSDVLPAYRLLRSALWQRPPPALSFV